MLRVGVVLPSLNRAFAYFLGFLLGDGFVGDKHNHLIYLVGHLTDERDFYDRVMVPLVKDLFNIAPRAFVKPGQDAYAVCFGSVQVVRYLKAIGFPLVAFRKFIPEVILRASPEIIRSFLQGLFDADGCLVFARRNYKTHRYPTIEIKSVHKEVADCVARMLTELGFRAPVRKSAESWVVSINGDAQLDKWMTEIGSRNIKHLSKLLVYRRFGSCPAHTTTPERLRKLAVGFEGFYLALLKETGINVLSF